MSDIIYLKMRGERQGDISAGCGTEASIGNRFQLGHENEIFTFSLSSSITGTGKGVNLQGLSFTKLIDKSSPLLTTAITNNEKLALEFNFYRISRYGMWEKYYSIELRGASLVDISVNVSNNTLDTEVITVRYDYILCKHLTASTEFSYLALPANYNSLFSPHSPAVQAEKPIQTINSKAAGRLLAAGGIYNGNIEGFGKTAVQLGGDTKAGYTQVMNNKGLLIAGASVAAGLTMGRMRFPELEELSELKNLHVLGTVEGEYSMMNPGPLSNRFAETFSGGAYKEITLSKDTIFYRGGQDGVSLGRFFSYEKPGGIIQTRIDSAVLPAWPNGDKSIIDSYFEVKIPAGAKVYVGEVGYQTDIYSGGAEQVLIPAPWDIPGVQILDFGGLK
ncbi:type VI secretion system tube protein TssD [Buttiauxella selenatireducens]|uniref:Type VI secretion system tube protein TssD n=1 Tax=Buttiauxella selenatireducens TaxID=3073902 RepID=A0ABY9SH04_9ENTR|nr:type VI secretion system tube protein TssD [Buttiauxella sp. R73]WMY76421.1 type VI secretion system tube protein TssD [Buttiauxella sp. R73]